MDVCLACNGPRKRRAAKFCSNKCQKRYEVMSKIKDFENGEYIGRIFQIRGWLRNYISENHNHVCAECGIKEWNGKMLTLEIDHIDGDASNNTSDNLRPLCPNCHSQTDTMRNKNRNSTRIGRRSSNGRTSVL